MNTELAVRYDRLERARRDLLTRLEGVDRMTLNRPRADGGWSVLQVLHHVVTAEEGTLRYMSKKMLAGTSLPRAGLVSRVRLLALQLANAAPLRFRAPGVTAEVPPQIEPDELRARWEEVRSEWKRFLDGFPEELLDRMVFRHGLVGLMGLHETLAFLQSHLDRHSRQVAERLDAS